MGTQNNNFAMSIKNNFINDSDEERTKYQTFRFGKNEKQLPLRKNCQLMAKVLNIYKFNKVSLKIFPLFCWHQKNRLLSKKSWKHLFLYLNIYLSIFLSVSLYIIYINLFCWTIPSILIMLHAFFTFYIMAFVFMAHFVSITKTLRNNQQDAFLRLFILAQYKSIWTHRIPRKY